MISLEAKLAAVLALALALASAAMTLFFTLDLPPLLAWTGGLFASLPLGLALLRLVTAPLNARLGALQTGLLNLQDNDFSVSLPVQGQDELAALASTFNLAADKLRQERQHIYQRELMLDTVLQSSPLALLLVDQRERALYANPVARQLLAGGKAVNGLSLDELAELAPAAVLEAMAQQRDGLFSLHQDDDSEIWHLSQSRFTLNGARHRLYIFKQLTKELSRAEVATWKKVIRVISHELNNSLAPISSMAHSGKLVLEQQPPDRELLASILDTVAERAAHLTQFLQGYARFAKLPQPNRSAQPWDAFLAQLQPLAPFRLEGELPAQPGWFDPTQLSQVLLNLHKNAVEAGSPAEAITLSVHQQGRWQRLQLKDRGPGMNEAVLTQALLPFYSTKSGGTGLGLALCREIIEAHDGRVRLQNRDGGGIEVSLWLPQQPQGEQGQHQVEGQGKVPLAEPRQ
ncbi:ATP-binding protein [Gallaecimonas sp. GXIMD4217]|uniref:sensor histidine kinase n=1 Tax=Gallaecimonas sp. GXIMD4217 TaxID=3131927 RepID=UPI00311ABBF5